MARRLVIVAVVACSSSPPPRPPDPQPRMPDAAIAVDAVSIDAHVVDAALRPDAAIAMACPASFAAASGRCAYSNACDYAEGSCHCGIPPWCGGMAPGDAYENQPPTWQCRPKVRADGCPGTQPAPGSRCNLPRKVCDYTCSCVLTATCTAKKWVIANGPCKP